MLAGQASPPPAGPEFVPRQESGFGIHSIHFNGWHLEFLQTSRHPGGAVESLKELAPRHVERSDAKSVTRTMPPLSLHATGRLEKSGSGAPRSRARRHPAGLLPPNPAQPAAAALLNRPMGQRPQDPQNPPSELIPTRDSLLSRLKDWQDDASWHDFFNTYWKLVYGVALKAGLTEQEAQEVVQETVITVARRIPEFNYDPFVCSFKTWLLNLTRWRIVDQLRKRHPSNANHHLNERPGNWPTPIDAVPDPASLDLESVWDAEWQQHLLQTAIQGVKRKVNPEQYQIFHLCVFKEWSAKKVSRELGVSAARVYLAKHRVGAMLKREIKSVEKKMNNH